MTRRPELWRAHERAWLRKHAAARRYERIFKNDDEPDADANDETDNADDEAAFAAALHYLMHTPHGAGVLRRAFPHGAGSTADIEHLARLIARAWRARPRDDAAGRDDVIGEEDTPKGAATMDPAVVKIAKAFVRTGKSFMSEDALTKMIFDHAQSGRLHDETPQQAFARAYTAPTAEGQLLRRAVAVAKQFSVDGGDVNDADADAAHAYMKLQQLADAQRRRHPDLTAERAFAKVFSDPANAALAARAHRRPVANAKNVFPFPR
jgi:hypothetical protein